MSQISINTGFYVIQTFFSFFYGIKFVKVVKKLVWKEILKCFVKNKCGYTSEPEILSTMKYLRNLYIKSLNLLVFIMKK